MSEIIKIAVQKSGRLSDDSIELIKECGISFNRGHDKLVAPATNFPMELLFLRDDDIPGYVADGVAHIAIVGENGVAEKGKDVEIVEKLGFAKCRLSIAIPKSKEYKGVAQLNGMSIATSYPKILTDFLKKNKIQADIHEISGSVEIAPGIGLASAICDIVSSGSTLLSNGLKEVENVFNSEAVLIANKNLTTAQKDILSDLLFRIKSVRAAKNNKYILLNAPKSAVDKIVSLLPGMNSPTIMPLVKDGWVSLHSVISEKQFWDVIGELKASGAEGILVIPIEKMIE